jgi:hypothetical protein
MVRPAVPVIGRVTSMLGGKPRVMCVLPIEHKDMIRPERELGNLNHFNYAVAFGARSYAQFLNGQAHLNEVYELDERITKLGKSVDEANSRITESSASGRTQDLHRRLREKEKEKKDAILLFKRALEAENASYRTDPDFLLFGLPKLESNISLLMQTVNRLRKGESPFFKGTKILFLVNYRELYSDTGGVADMARFLVTIVEMREIYRINGIIDISLDRARTAWTFNHGTRDYPGLLSFLYGLFPGSKVLVVADPEIKGQKGEMRLGDGTRIVVGNMEDTAVKVTDFAREHGIIV